jgi:hypothetical protein
MTGLALRDLFRCRPAGPVEPTAPARASARFDADKLHPAWRPGAGFELRLGEGPGTPITLEGLRTHIAAARFVHGDYEANRLQAELDSLLEISERYDRNALGRTRTGGHSEDDRQ